MENDKKLLYGLFTMVIILQLIYVAMQQRLTTVGDRLNELQVQIHNQAGANSVLQEQVLKYESFTTIAREAKQAGFVQGTVMYIK